MLPDERDLAFLWDMLDAASKAQEYLAGISRQQLETDDLRLSAVHWQLIVLGESARRIRREFREATTGVDWVEIFRQRNFYAHDYDQVDPGDAWTYVTRDLPALAQALRELLG